MLKSRWLSTFTIIGAILIVLGIVGLVVGPRFVYDPGQPVTGKEAWCYLGIGFLMVMNGLMTPPAEEKQPQKPGASGPGIPRRAVPTPARPSASNTSASNGTGRPADVPIAADKNE